MSDRHLDTNYSAGQKMLSFITVIISGFFGLFVAFGTFWLTSRKEVAALERATKKERKNKLEMLYIDEIAVFEKVIRYVENRQEFALLFDEMARLNARMKLSASKEVLEQAEKMSDLIHAWSSEYLQGQPSLIPDTSFSVISNMQTPHQEKAKHLYTNVVDTYLKMIDMMKQEIQQIDV